MNEKYNLFRKKENTNILNVTTRIEFCGTPFRGKYTLLVNGTLDNLLTRETGKKHRGLCGMSLLPDPLNDSENELPLYTNTVCKLVERKKAHAGVLLLTDGPFQAMVVAEMYMKAGRFKDEKSFQEWRSKLLRFIQMEDLICVTLIKPRAVLSRIKLIFETDKDHLEEIKQRIFIQIETYNNTARQILDQYGHELPETKLIDIPGDIFDGDIIYKANKNAVFKTLGLD
ncbi:MAG: hypothetical protein ABIJ43_02220 [Candidatus Beckwithbacteria bacterium]